MNYQSAITEDSVEQFFLEGRVLLSLPDEAHQPLAKTFKSAYSFFQSPLEEKNSNRLPQDIGYRPMGMEYSQSSERPDPVESFTADFRTCEAVKTLPSARARQMYKHMLSTISILEHLAESLVVQLAERSVGRAHGYRLLGAFRRWSCLQVNFARPAVTGAPFLHELHEDGHLLTILSANRPGLEVRVGDGSFLPISTAPDQVLVMPGEILWLLSGGRIRPLYHRVRCDSTCPDRMALLFFADIDPALCKPWIENETNLGVDIGARVLTNALRFGLEPYQPE
jgi:isopenicillin N synthase-like dioxygenase